MPQKKNISMHSQTKDKAHYKIYAVKKKHRIKQKVNTTTTIKNKGGKKRTRVVTQTKELFPHATNYQH